uniref:BPTI/Kunitz inhibitor domain-containing protein n=1 Tax=Anolis carolinensis TaxID=28377 RepID=A0A803SUY9_ANOCA
SANLAVRKHANVSRSIGTSRTQHCFKTGHINIPESLLLICFPTALPKRCSLPLDRGTGNENIKAYFYCKKSNRCVWFTYRGSGGNANRFKSQQACMKKCGIKVGFNTLRRQAA